jgi:hypothetical protein
MAVLLGAMLTAASAASLVACESDDTSTENDGGSDATMDVTLDQTVDGADVIAPDASPDANPDGDAAPQTDADAETDADATTDANADADASDGGGVVIVPAPEAGAIALAHEIAVNFCIREGQCCNGQAGDPSWELDKCIASQEGAIQQGPIIQMSRTGILQALDAGVGLSYDSTLGSSCLTLFRNLPCTYSGEDIAKLRQDCFNAIVGGVNNGGPCSDAIQCATGRCTDAGLTDGGTACQPLLAQGNRCTVDEDCEYRGTGQPEFFCDHDPATHDAGNPSTCEVRRALGVKCFNTKWDPNLGCASGICSTTMGCIDSKVLNSAIGCAAFTDAGTPDAASDAPSDAPDGG